MAEGVPPTLVLLPGLDGTGLLFRRFIDARPSELETRILTLPQSGAMGYAALARRVEPALPRDRPYVLLGESFSAPLALALAALRPPGLVAVILCVTFVSPPAWAALRHFVTPWLFRMRAPGLGFRLFLAGRDAPPDLRDDLLAARRASDPEATAARLRVVLGCAAEDDLRNCPVPLMALVASADRLVRSGSARRMLRARPTLKMISIAGPHLLLQTGPAACWAAIGEFVESLAQPARNANTSSTC